MLYRGPDIPIGSITIGRAHVGATRRACASADLEPQQKNWVERAQQDDSILYFAVRAGRQFVGQIMLHDIQPNEAMVGYHIFWARRRGRGHGTHALAAVCEFAFGQLAIDRLVLITALNNMASRRIAEKCGFVEIGPAREGPDLVCYELRARASPVQMSP